jgi:ABC-type nitrate/sulfonate/bicarbonate transport system substrate-binding protein
MLTSSERKVIAYLLLSLVLSCFFPAETGAQPKLQNLEMAYGAISASRFPYWVAKEAKLYEKYGLNVRLVYISGAPISLNALVAGDVQLVATSGVAAISLAAQGAPIVIIASIGATPYKIVAHPSITSIEGLRGKTTGTDRIGGATDFALQDLLPKLGLVPNKDVKLLATGLSSSADRINLIQHGKIDATLAVPDNVLKMAKHGIKVNVLADLAEHGVYTSGGDLMTSRQLLKQKRSEIVAFLMAISEAIWLARNDKELVLQVFRKYLKVDDPSLLEGLYNNYVLEMVKTKPYPEERGLQRYVDLASPSVPQLKGGECRQLHR